MDEQRTARGEQRRGELLAIARRVLIDDGIDSFVMRRIADQSGMQLGNLQYYFATRDDLLEAVVRAEFAGDVTAVAALHDDDPERHLTRAVQLLTDRWIADAGSVYPAVGVLALHHERFATVWREIYDEFYGLIGRIIRRIDPTASPAQARLRATLITSLVDGASLQRHPALTDRHRLAASIARLAVVIARGG